MMITMVTIELVIIFLIFAFGLFTILLLDISNKDKVLSKQIELSPIEHLVLLGFSDFGSSSNLVYSYVKEVYKRSLVFEEQNDKVHFINYDRIEQSVTSISLKDIVNVLDDIKSKTVTIKTQVLENPIIVLQTGSKEEFNRLLSGLDILLKKVDIILE
jgi:hypothetical protein